MEWIVATLANQSLTDETFSEFKDKYNLLFGWPGLRYNKVTLDELRDSGKMALTQDQVL